MKILEILTPKRKIGNAGEALATRYLKKKKYKILRRNYAPFDSEIDIIAEDKEHVVFVEVKTRNVKRQKNAIEPRPASAVTPEKQRKIISAAKYYIGGRENTKKLRFDIVEVYINDKGKAAKIIHMENAFSKDTAYRKVY